VADDTKKAPEGDKKVEAPKTLEEAVAILTAQAESIAKLEGALKETTKESIERKEKIRAAEKEKADAEQKRLAEEGKFKELVDQYKPKAERADALETALKGYLDLEMADIPEEKRSLIPTGPVETQLTWLKNAKVQGLFGEPKKAPLNSEQGKKGDGNTPEFLTYAPNDKRLETLSAEDYSRWKKHNGRDGSKGSSNQPVGWGAVRK
jgi:hypothetical protein